MKHILFRSQNTANSSPNPSIRNFLNLNPNIGPDGRNLPLAGNIATVVVLVTGLGILIPLILKEEFGLDFVVYWDIFTYLAPLVNNSLVVPSLFFAKHPNAVNLILEVIEDKFGLVFFR